MLSEINSCQFLFLVEIGEPQSNELLLVLSEARVSPQTKSIILGEVLLDDLHPVVIDENCRRFRLHWKTYIAYSVRNESYTIRDAYEEYDGNIAVLFHKSRYLDFIKLSTFANRTHPGLYRHWGFFCEDHIIDVVAVDAPEIHVEGLYYGESKSKE
jgi:hypothetical protein